MKLTRTLPPDAGSLSVVFRCPSCEREIAMLTNPYETEVVGSLGVKIGDGEKAGEAPAEGEAGASKCPFAAMAREMGLTGGHDSATPAEMAWTASARERLQNIPEFVRPMAKTGIERFARDNGHAQIDEAVLDEAKDYFGM
jgi:hypothetical protein